MEDCMPNYDLGLLITLDIAIALMSLCGIMGCLIYMSRQLGEARASTERIASIAERIDARLRRQYADIDRDLQEIKDLLRG
jgi:hypothetical protein